MPNYIGCLYIVSLFSFFLTFRPPADNSSRFQEPTAVREAVSALPTGSPFYPPGTSSLGSDIKAKDDGTKARNGNRVSSMAAAAPSTQSSAAASTPSASSSSSGSKYTEFYTEPGLEMSRADWWQNLVIIYHPNSELGTRLVMADIAHL